MALGLCALTALLGCEDELSYSTYDREVFTGEVIDAEFLRAAPSGADHLLAPGTAMELTLHMRSLDTQPGRINTSDGLLDDEVLVMLPQITCDRMSALEIPGNFLRSLVFLAPTSAPELEGADAVLFVSLGEGDAVEVRVLAGAGEGRRAFGVFRLDRERVEEAE